MRRKYSTPARSLPVAAGILVLLQATPAKAEGFELQQFRPACGDSDVLAVASARILAVGPGTTTIFGNWADSPLRLASGARTIKLVNSEQELDAGLSFSPLAGLETTLIVPLAAEQLDAESVVVIRRNEPRQGISDLRFQAKTSIFETDSTAVAAVVGASVPTGSASGLRGHGGPVLAPAVAAEIAPIPHVRVLINAAIAFRDDRDVSGVRVGDALRYGVGVESGMGSRDLHFLCSVTGEAGLPAGGTGRNPAEALFGIRYRRSHSPMSFVLAAGPGLGTGYGSPRYRLVLGLYFGTGVRTESPSSQNIAPPPSVTTPTEMEPVRVEPTLVETTAKQVAEAIPSESRVAVKPPVPIELDQQVLFKFKSTTVDADAADILRSVAEILSAHPEISRVEIRGFSDAQGDSSYNEALSLARANAVKDFLEQNGIDSSRLVCVGLSSQSPQDVSHSRAAHARNRRVEFKILDARSR